MAPVRVLSLGAGVQSTTVLLMALAGEIEPIDAAIFADTGDEPEPVYRHLETLAARCEAAELPLYTVGKNDSTGIRGDMTEMLAGTRKRYDQPPLFVRNADGTKGQIRRRCTKGHKIEPIERKIKHLAGVFGARNIEGVRVEQIFGISWDETQRMRDPALSWIRYSYPLVDLRMTRHDCFLWMERHGEPEPPRSACVYCPYRSDREWRNLRDDDPAGFAVAVEFDRQIRNGRPFAIDGDQFVHPSLLPLDQVDLSTAEDHGQLSLFGNDCGGHCGL